MRRRCSSASSGRGGRYGRGGGVLFGQKRLNGVVLFDNELAGGGHNFLLDPFGKEIPL